MKIPSLLALLLLLLFGCGKEIGDECVISADCSPNGDRVCIDPPAGYCTVQGCDFNTCPEEAVCVRFFTGSFADKPCQQACEDLGPGELVPSECPPDGDGNPQPTDHCSLDELCSIAGQCVSRSSEIRFCMRKCDSDDECREGYECRDRERQTVRGGEPVLGSDSTEDAPKFCATAPG